MYPYDNTTFPAVELGASIFVPANKNLWRAADEFNLTRHGEKKAPSIGIWDGTQFILTVRISILSFTPVSTQLSSS